MYKVILSKMAVVVLIEDTLFLRAGRLVRSPVVLGKLALQDRMAWENRALQDQGFKSVTFLSRPVPVTRRSVEEYFEGVLDRS